MSDKRADTADVGAALHRFIAELYPLCRSITGDGVRATLAAITHRIPALPLTVHEVPSGTRVFDWTIPPEWNVREAWIANARGERVVDFARSNLHLVGYSVPVDARMTLAELRPHLHTLPTHPDWIPFRTTYYDEDWGFCLGERQLQALPDDTYQVRIDSTLAPGSLTYGEAVLPATEPEAGEILLSCHVCHPSLANDNLAGIAVATELAARLAARPRRRYAYRFLFIPGTIGSITWLARNEGIVARIRHGLVLTCLGDRGRPTYKRSRRGDTEIDRIAAHVLATSGGAHRIVPFEPWGYDERQYCSPGFDLAVGSLMRTPYGQFPEYHTSADDLTFVDPAALGESLVLAEGIVAGLEANRVYRRRDPRAEPQLGRRGLWDPVGGRSRTTNDLAMLWVLNLCDGRHTLLDVAERAGIPLATLAAAAERLVTHGLLDEVDA